MKYIRTQKELYKVMQKQICNTDKFVEVQRKKIGLFTGTTELISKDDIIKQADTIEELCDCYVIVRKDDITIGGELKTLKEMLLQRDCDIEYEVEDDYFYYGAIWTDKGLIYVAKLNDKGELELL